MAAFCAFRSALVYDWLSDLAYIYNIKKKIKGQENKVNGSRGQHDGKNFQSGVKVEFAARLCACAKKWRWSHSIDEMGIIIMVWYSKLLLYVKCLATSIWFNGN